MDAYGACVCVSCVSECGLVFVRVCVYACVHEKWYMYIIDNNLDPTHSFNENVNNIL